MANHPIFAPVFRGDVPAVRGLLEADRPAVSVLDAKGLTPMHVAASRGQDKVIRLLLDYGADVSGPTESGEWTPLVFASYRGHFNAAKLLIENGAETGRKGGSPIHFAGQRRHRDICRLLVEHGAIDELIESKDSETLALFRAAYSYDTDSVKEILAARPDLIDSVDTFGRTPLHEACTHGDSKTVRALLKSGADVSARDHSRQTPLDRAVAHNQRAVIALLEKHASA